MTEPPLLPYSQRVTLASHHTPLAVHIFTVVRVRVPTASNANPSHDKNPTPADISLTINSKMAAADSFIPRSLFTLRRDVVHPIAEDRELASFQNQVAALLDDITTVSGGPDLLSIDWIRRLLDTFLICQEEFRMVLFSHRARSTPVDRIMDDYFNRAVKSLDVLNAVRDSISQLRQWMNHVEIVLTALNPTHRAFGTGHLRRASKALAELSVLMLDRKDADSPAHRNRSFNRRDTGSGAGGARDLRFRSLSWSISRTWSAARQIQSIGTNLAPPKPQEIAATGGLANTVYTMSSVLLFVSWSLAIAFPCFEGGSLQANFSIPRSFPWAESIMAMHDRIVEEAKKRERKRSSGLLKEIQRIERCVKGLMELIGSGNSAMTEEREGEVRREVEKLARVKGAMEDKMEPLERQVREVFRRIVRNRTEGLDSSSAQNECLDRV